MEEISLFKAELPLAEIDEDNGACGDPECCGGYADWHTIIDARHRRVYHGGYGTEEFVAALNRLAAEHAEMKKLLGIVLERYNQPDCSGAPKPETIFAIRALLAKIGEGK